MAATPSGARRASRASQGTHIAISIIQCAYFDVAQFLPPGGTVFASMKKPRPPEDRGRGGLICGGIGCTCFPGLKGWEWARQTKRVGSGTAAECRAAVLGVLGVAWHGNTASRARSCRGAGWGSPPSGGAGWGMTLQDRACLDQLHPQGGPERRPETDGHERGRTSGRE